MATKKPKTPGSGRKLGTPNKNTMDLMAKCEEMGVDVFAELLKYLIHPCDEVIRLKAIDIAAKYLYPTRKAIEIEGKIEHIEVIIHDYTARKVIERNED